MIETILLILDIVTLVFGVLAIGLCVLFGIKRGTFNSGMRIAVLLISAVIAFFVANWIDHILSDVAMGIITSTVAHEIINMPSALTLIEYIVRGIMMPLLYLPIFFIIDKILLIPYFIVKSKLKNNEKLHGFKFDKLFGGIIGGVVGAIIALIGIMPFSGYELYLAHTHDLFRDTSLEEVIPEEFGELVDGLADAPALKANGFLTNWFFHSLTDKLDVATESISVLVHTYEAVLAPEVDDPAITPEQKEEKAKQKIDSLKESLHGLTHESAELTAGIIKDAVGTMIQDAHEEAPIDLVGKVLADVVIGLDDVKEAITEEEFDNEVESISHLVELATKQENVNAVESVKTVLESKVVSDAVAGNKEEIIEKYDNEFSNASEETKTEIKNMIEEKKNSAEYEKYADTIEIIEKLFGIKVQ